jgi:hypothetical protein
MKGVKGIEGDVSAGFGQSGRRRELTKFLLLDKTSPSIPIIPIVSGTVETLAGTGLPSRRASGRAETGSSAASTPSFQGPGTKWNWQRLDRPVAGVSNQGRRV